MTAVRVARQVRALAAVGHPDGDVAAWLGVDVDIVRQLQADGLCGPALAGVVDRVYDREAMRPGRCDRTQRQARQAGWCTALAWDDDELDNPAAHPDLGDLGDAPRRPDSRSRGALLPCYAATVAGNVLLTQLVRDGMSDVAIAKVLKVHRTTVSRQRQALGLSPASAGTR